MAPVVYLAEQLARPADYVIETMGAPDAGGGVAIAILSSQAARVARHYG
jgi:Ca2+:H+ antiporter